MSDCLFCKIIAGEIPSTKVYEDQDVVAFLDISPVNKGHTLVVPKSHAENFLVVSEDVSAKAFGAAQKVAKAVLAATGAHGFNLHVNNGHVSGQVVDHLHIHIIPRFEGDGLEHWPKMTYGSGEMWEVGEKIKKSINQRNDMPRDATL
ncbi:MAG: HIT family protein [bacterium]